jgi:hypothetical protein
MEDKQAAEQQAKIARQRAQDLKDQKKRVQEAVAIANNQAREVERRKVLEDEVILEKGVRTGRQWHKDRTRMRLGWVQAGLMLSRQILASLNILSIHHHPSLSPK